MLKTKIHWLLPIILLAGCVRKPSLPENKTLRVGVSIAPKTCDPRWALDMVSRQCAQLVSQALITLDKNFRAQIDLASNVVTTKHTQFTFKIPKLLNFSNGDKIKNIDILNSFNYYKKNSSRLKKHLSEISKIYFSDNQTLNIILNKANPHFLTTVVPEVKIVKSTKNGFIASGPYKLIDNKATLLLFAKNLHYKSFAPHKKNRVLPFDYVELHIVGDLHTRYLKLSAGDIDVLHNMLSPQIVFDLRNSKKLNFFSSSGNTYHFINLNHRLPKFAKTEVREALSLAINRENIIKHKLKGFAKIASSALPTSHYLFNKRLKAPKYNPVKAKKIIRKHFPKGLSINITTSTQKEYNSILKIIIDDWKKVGVNAKLTMYEWGLFYNKVKSGNFEAYNLQWTNVRHERLFNRIFYSKNTPPGQNRGYYKNQKVDSILDETNITSHPDRNRELYAQLQEIINKDYPYLHLWHTDNVTIFQKNIRLPKDFHSASWVPLIYSSKGSKPL